MSKIGSISDVAVISTAAQTINNNYDILTAAFSNTLSRDGSTPNQMEADIDLNGNDLINVGTIDADVVRIDGVDITTNISQVSSLADQVADSVITAAGYAAAAGISATEANAAFANIMDHHRGLWANTVSYLRSDMVLFNGATYICKLAHTSVTAVNQPETGTNWNDYWQLMASKGQPGMGTGDVVAANGGAEFAPYQGTFRNNISAMLRAITKRSGLNLATDAAIDSTIYNSDGTNTNGPPGNTDNDSFVAAKIDANNHNFIWFGNAKAWIGRRAANVNSWVQLLTSNMLTGTGSFVVSAATDPVPGDAGKAAQFDANGNVVPGFKVIDTPNLSPFSTVDAPSQAAVHQAIISSAGTSRAWQNMLGSRSAITIYQNTNLYAIEASIAAITSGGTRNIEVSADGNTNWIVVGRTQPSYVQCQNFTIPPLYYYRINGSITTLLVWSELR